MPRSSAHTTYTEKLIITIVIMFKLFHKNNFLKMKDVIKYYYKEYGEASCCEEGSRVFLRSGRKGLIREMMKTVTRI